MKYIILFLLLAVTPVYKVKVTYSSWDSNCKVFAQTLIEGWKLLN